MKIKNAQIIHNTGEIVIITDNNRLYQLPL